MADLEELAPDIYGVLLIASMGASADDLVAAAKESGTKEENIELVMKAAEKIIDETLLHQEKLLKIATREDISDDQSDQMKEDYLREQGVNEQLIEHIIIYNTFVLIKAATEKLVEEGEKEGYTEQQIKKIMLEEMGLEKNVVDQMYDAATHSFTDAPARPPLSRPKPAGQMFFTGIILLVLAYLDYQIAEETLVPAYIPAVAGLIFIVIGFVRMADSG